MATYWIRGLLALLACAGMVVSPAMAAPVNIAAKQAVQQMPSDVSLQSGGKLVGQVLNTQGRPVAGAPVVIQLAGKEIARVQTDKAGKFSIDGLHGGVHVVTTEGQQSVCRLWAPQTAPPVAQRGIMLVNSTDIVRAQNCGAPVCGAGVASGGGVGGGIGNWVANHPVLSVGAVAAAIAIPLALDDDNSAPATP